MKPPKLTAEQKENTVIVGGSIGTELALGAAKTIGMKPGELSLKQFPNSELYAQFNESVRGKDVFVIQPHAREGKLDVSGAIMEHLIIIDTARRASASNVTAIAPFYGYARQDRKKDGREPISAKLLANLYEAAGATSLMAVDLHIPQIQGFFDPVFDNLTAMRALRKRVKRLIPKVEKDQWAMVTPDLGRAKVAKKWASELGIGLAVIDKDRAKDGTVSSAQEAFPELKDKHCILIDDMIDTAGTLVNGARIIHQSGAAGIVVAATHAPFSDRALMRIEGSAIDKVIITNTTPTAEAKEALKDQLEVVDISPIIGQAIGRIVTKGSLSEMFNGEDRS